MQWLALAAPLVAACLFTTCPPLLQGAAAAQTAGGAEGLAVAAERFQEALAAKDELLTHLDGELAERKRQAAAYEGR